MSKDQKIAINLHTNRAGRSTITMHVYLGFKADLSDYEKVYLQSELRKAIRSALLLQFGQKANHIQPSAEEPEVGLNLFSGTTLPDGTE